MPYKVKKYLVLPLNADGSAKLPESLGAWDTEKAALSQAELVIMQDKTSKGYYIAEVLIKKVLFRSTRIQNLMEPSKYWDVTALILALISFAILAYEIYISFPLIKHLFIFER